jgi:outer membrane protein OmpA-like peptidoglycan-associated protein
VRALNFPILIIAGALLAGCASDEIVVLPEEGAMGGVVVEKGGDKTVLDKPYAKQSDGLLGGSNGTSSETEVKASYGDALAAQPIPPKSYTLYFIEGSDELVPDSKAAFEDIFKEIAARKAAEIVVTGHTDTVGSLKDNDRLSRERAVSVEKLFVARGIPGDALIAVGRGERELVVSTPPNTPEPKNRRVVITVR